MDSSHHNKSRDLNTIIGGSTNDGHNKKQKQKNLVVKEKNSKILIQTEPKTEKETEKPIKNSTTSSKNNKSNSNNNNNNNDNTNNNESDQTDKKVALKQKSKSSLNSSGSLKKTESKVETKSEPTRKPLLIQKSQQDLVNLAFAGPDLEAEFETLKDKTIDEELNISDKKRKILTEGLIFLIFLFFHPFLYLIT